jgi:RNA polymerase sigma-70 factor (ECF subfamily)
LNEQKQIIEEELVPLLLKKSSRGLEILYDNYSAVLFGVIHRIIQNDELAEEILKNTFVKIWNNFSQFNPAKDRLDAWFINVARNNALDKMRSSGEIEKDQYRKVENILARAEGSRSFVFDPSNKEVRKLIENMDIEYREILYLLFFAGFSQAEVALKLNIPLGTVKNRSRMAIMKLRNHFDNLQG